MYTYHHSLIFLEHTYTLPIPLLTRPHMWLVTDHRDAHPHTPNPAYKTAHVAGRRSGRWTHTHTPNPAYKTTHVAGCRSGRWTHTYTKLCLQDRTCGWSPVREMNTYINDKPCLQDCTWVWSLVIYIHTHTSPFLQDCIWMDTMFHISTFEAVEVMPHLRLGWSREFQATLSIRSTTLSWTASQVSVSRVFWSFRRC